MSDDFQKQVYGNGHFTLGQRYTPIPDPLSDTNRVCAMNVLGVQLRDDLKDIDSVLASCTRSLYALRLLRAQGLASHALHKVTMATTIARMLYAALAWWDLTRAVKSCQNTHPCNRCRQQRLTVYTQAYSQVEQGRSCHLCQTQFKVPGHYLCE